MLKGLYIGIAIVAFAPIIVVQTVVSLLVWDSKHFDNVFSSLIDTVEGTINQKL